MLQLSGYHVLIVDRQNNAACDLRSMLVRLGAHVHVVSTPAAALLLAQRKKLSAAMLEFSLDRATVDLCRGLSDLGVPYLYAAALSENTVDADAKRRELHPEAFSVLLAQTRLSAAASVSAA